MAVIDGELHQWSIGDNQQRWVKVLLRRGAGEGLPSRTPSEWAPIRLHHGGDNTVTSNDEELISVS